MTMEKMAKEYFALEVKIIEGLDELENADNECNCDDCETINFIHDGEWPEIVTRCLNCGGMVSNG